MGQKNKLTILKVQPFKKSLILLSLYQLHKNLYLIVINEVTPKLELFELIKSLSSGERMAVLDYGTKSDRNSNPVYLQLFKAISECEEYDERKIKQKFKGKKILNNFSTYKRHLYFQILRVLNNNAQSSLEVLSFYINSIRFFIGKNLYHHTDSFFEKAFELVEAIENFSGHIELIKLFMVVQSRKSNSYGYLSQFRLFKEKIENLSQKESTINEFYILHNETMKLRMGEVVEKEKVINKLKKNTILKDINRCDSTSAKIYFHLIQYNIHLSKGELLIARNHYVEVIVLFDQFPDLLSDIIKSAWYLDCTYYISLINISLGYFQEAEDWLHKLQGLKSSQNISSIMIFERVSILQMTLAKELLDLNAGKNTIGLVQRKLSEFRYQINEGKYFELIFSICHFYIRIGKSGRCLSWIERLKDIKGSDFRIDIQAYCRIFHLIVLFEKKEWELLDSAINHARYFYKLKGLFTEYERTLLEFFRKMLQNPNKAKKRAILDEYHLRISKIIEKPDYAKQKFTFEISDWFVSIIENTKILDLMRKRQLESGSN